MKKRITVAATLSLVAAALAVLIPVEVRIRPSGTAQLGIPR